MELKQVFIDLTSKNNLFNPVESQGSFLSHRFGKRNIPEEHLDFRNLTNFLISELPDQIILESVFGDPFEYNKIEELFEFCIDHNIQIICLTNGISKKIKLVEGNNSFCIFKLYGYSNTFNIVTPNGDFSKVEHNLKYCDKINYFVYRENLQDLHNVQNNIYNIDVEYFHGPTVGHNINHIMSERGEWLHDVTSLPEMSIDYHSLKKLDDDPITLTKSLAGYKLLKAGIKEVKGKSILDLQLPKTIGLGARDSLRPKIDKPIEIKPSISYKGHLFNNLYARDLVTNGYIPDWSLDVLHVNQVKAFDDLYLYDLKNNKLLRTFSDFTNNIKSI